MNLSFNMSAFNESALSTGSCTIINTTHEIGTFALILGFIGLYILSAVVHEFGHWVILQTRSRTAKMMFGRDDNKIRFVTGTQENYYYLDKEFKGLIYWTGIIFGLIPIMIAGLYHIVFFLMLAPYLVNCYSDFEKIIRK